MEVTFFCWLSVQSKRNIYGALKKFQNKIRYPEKNAQRAVHFDDLPAILNIFPPEHRPRLKQTNYHKQKAGKTRVENKELSKSHNLKLI